MKGVLIMVFIVTGSTDGDIMGIACHTEYHSQHSLISQGRIPSLVELIILNTIVNSPFICQGSLSSLVQPVILNTIVNLPFISQGHAW